LRYKSDLILRERFSLKEGKRRGAMAYRAKGDSDRVTASLHFVAGENYAAETQE